ncbi:MAG: hypothetical protein J6K72_06625 [Clostridia bacterium]|nr:hypothetical protein [Clostridia bacterium]
MNVYYIGGSPCSGKSTVTEALSERYGLHYFKVDDYLDRYMQLAADDRKLYCSKALRLTPEQTWMRQPTVQCEEELRIYEEIFEYILADLENIDCQNGVITEGAAYLPALAKMAGIPMKQYISITPTKEFQVFHYSKREWVPYVLAECSNKEKAFANWMDRDALFALAVQQQCAELGYTSLINDGTASVDALTDRVIAYFGLQ